MFIYDHFVSSSLYMINLFEETWQYTCVISILERHHVDVNTLRPEQNDHHFTDDSGFLTETFILVQFSLKIFLEGPIDNKPSSV